ncbi:CoA transferase [Natronolimnobius sp. AArcel1]|uniref:CaiB/BaiF CoA transferase family protein n=1 Tax=Natronolimnobius sp. AArcel1 TaxID=1679093 RepID=UPI0013EA6E72|nr:CoA transferase [Natronolimnobius sp. AArcel1]NGM70503.1 CoA transferase [Natronolimnobius sp. AArcel1]
MTLPLDGIRIADFTQMMQGPWATQKLADMGADVVKIERPGGEWERFLEAGGETLEGTSPFFLAMNRNKRSIELDLKRERGQKLAREFVADADVVVENFRPGVMERFGLDYETVSEQNPDIIYVSASGFGPDGPYVDRPGQDLLLQAMSGLARYTGRRDDPPTPVGTAVVDEHAASLIALHTTMALFHRERTDEGQRVDVNLFNAALDLQCQELTAVLNLEREFERSEEGIAQAWLDAPYGIYETADGYVAIAMAPLETVSDALDLEELAEYAAADAYERRDEIKRLLEAETRTRATDDLVEALLAVDVWVAPVNDFHDVAEDPQVKHNEMLIELEHPDGGTFTTTGSPVDYSKTPATVRTNPPAAGEHTRELLTELGYDETAYKELVADGVVGTLVENDE